MIKIGFFVGYEFPYVKVKVNRCIYIQFQCSSEDIVA
jgi:hypothetical protein